MAARPPCRRRDRCSVCTGSVLLAAAGLLDGEDATTHWSACDLFARHFPRVALRPERIVRRPARATA